MAKIVKMAKKRTIKRKSMKPMKKRTMSKMKKGVKKIIRKSRKMRGGALADYLPSFFTGKKPQQNYDMTNESNSSFKTQETNGAQPIEQYTEEEYKILRENPNKYASDKPIDEITMKEKSSWFPF
jgi:selenocysteine lyase/cysteine desulfurase